MARERGPSNFHFRREREGERKECQFQNKTRRTGVHVHTPNPVPINKLLVDQIVKIGTINRNPLLRQKFCLTLAISQLTITGQPSDLQVHPHEAALLPVLRRPLPARHRRRRRGQHRRRAVGRRPRRLRLAHRGQPTRSGRR